MKNKEISLYVHIPFCSKKCPYCDFYKTIWKNENENLFVESIIREIHCYSKLNLTVKTLFLGGGTPSKLQPVSLEKILTKIHSCFHVSSDAEKTSEANPESATDEFLETLLKFSFTRISLGVQSCHEKELKKIGRWHTIEHIDSALSRLKKNSWNFNCDLIFGLPNSTKESFVESIDFILPYQPNHISTYSLTIEDNTPFKKKGIKPVDDTIEDQQYNAALYYLNSYGYHHYEVSAFCKPSYECKHNLAYWSFDDYIGIGPSASSFFNKKRWTNVASLTEYAKKPYPVGLSETCKEIDIPTLKKEFLISTLRKKEGFNIDRYNTLFNHSFTNEHSVVLEKLSNEDFIQVSSDYVKPTEKGFRYLNTILESLIESIDNAHRENNAHA